MYLWRQHLFNSHQGLNTSRPFARLLNDPIFMFSTKSTAQLFYQISNSALPFGTHPCMFLMCPPLKVAKICWQDH